MTDLFLPGVLRRLPILALPAFLPPGARVDAGMIFAPHLLLPGSGLCGLVLMQLVVREATGLKAA